jgi:excinuclease ABC subunit B
MRLSSLDYHDALIAPPPPDLPDSESLRRRIADLEKAMKAAAKGLDFEEAARLRDELRNLRELQIFR